MDVRLVRLRVELYTAAQTLEGEDAEEFWSLLEEVMRMRAAFSRLAEPRP